MARSVHVSECGLNGMMHLEFSNIPNSYHNCNILNEVMKYKPCFEHIHTFIRAFNMYQIKHSCVENYPTVMSSIQENYTVSACTHTHKANNIAYDRRFVRFSLAYSASLAAYIIPIPSNFI